MHLVEPNEYQKRAIRSGLTLFQEAKKLLDVAGSDAAQRHLAVSECGYLLLEAPTGSGKTLIAGRIVEEFGKNGGVVWFWFAPFKGVVGQTESFLRTQCAGLRVRDVRTHRDVSQTQPGDVFVTTWASIASRRKEALKVHQDGDDNAAVESFLEDLRDRGLRIRVVVDEAHHGFHEDTQAAEFFTKQLRPDHTLLITATPDDAQLKAMLTKLGNPRLNRTAISREDARREGLIKDGVRCVAYLAEEGQRQMVDFVGAALADARAIHEKIKRELVVQKAGFAPLLLVQADDKRPETSVKRLKERLLSLGFKEEQVAVHTAREPDPDVLALAHDDRVEVLIFMMAVAQGFDAPRAFVLASMRATRDEDFGVQLVGRILRVHRRLQGLPLPELLRNGYVFMADSNIQDGLDMAAQRINKMQTCYAQVSPRVGMAFVGGTGQVQVLGPGGQMHLIPKSLPVMDQPPADGDVAPEAEFQFDEMESVQTSLAVEVVSGMRMRVQIPGAAEETHERDGQTGLYRYALRKEGPLVLRTERLASEELEGAEEECAKRFLFGAKEILEALGGRVSVQRRTLEIFSQELLAMDETSAALETEEVGRMADSLLRANRGRMDPKVLWEELCQRFTEQLESLHLEDVADVTKREHMLRLILVRHPNLLRKARREVQAERTVAVDAAPLESFLESEEPLPLSLRNRYGRIPPGLNSWEIEFAHILDNDRSGRVLWWHRNEPNKPWSVRIILEDGSAFYPDFVIAIKDRKKPDGIVLVDPKDEYARGREALKVGSRHQEYGNAMVIHWQDELEWITIRYDEDQGTGRRDRIFELRLLENW